MRETCRIRAASPRGIHTAGSSSFCRVFCFAMGTTAHDVKRKVHQKLPDCRTGASCARRKYMEAEPCRKEEPNMTTDAEKMILIERLDRASRLKNKMVTRAKEESLVYLHAAETAGAAGIVGYYEGRPGKQNLIDGIPLDFPVAPT